MIDLEEFWTPTQSEFDRFAEVSGDDNAIHVNPAFATTTAFGRTVSHGMLIYTKIWGVLRRHMPQARFVTQKLMFPNPAFAEEKLILKLRQKTPSVLEMRVTRMCDGAECLVGEAEILC